MFSYICDCVHPCVVSARRGHGRTWCVWEPCPLQASFAAKALAESDNVSLAPPAFLLFSFLVPVPKPLYPPIPVPLLPAPLPLSRPPLATTHATRFPCRLEATITSAAPSPFLHPLPPTCHHVCHQVAVQVGRHHHIKLVRLGNLWDSQGGGRNHRRNTTGGHVMTGALGGDGDEIVRVMNQ